MGALWFLFACSGSTDATKEADTARSASDSAPPATCALWDEDGVLSWQAAGDRATIEFTLADPRFSLTTEVAAVGSFPLPRDVTVGGTLTVDGAPARATSDVTLTAEDGAVCALTTSHRPSPLTAADDPVVSRSVPDDGDACTALALEVWRPATGAGVSEDGNQLRLTHPCSGSVLAAVDLGPAVLEAAGLNDGAEIADATLLPDGTVAAIVETVPGLQGGTLLRIDLLEEALLEAAPTRSASGAAWDGAELHHGIAAVGGVLYSTAWSQEERCGQTLTSSLLATIDPETAVTTVIDDPLLRDISDCDSVSAGSRYHFYANSVSPSTMPGGAPAACLTVIDSTATGLDESGGLVFCVDENQEMLAIAQEGIVPLPFSPEHTARGGQRAVMPPLTPFLHSAAMRADDSGDGVTLVTLTLGDPKNDYEDPRIQVMRSTSTTDGVESRRFETVCTHDVTDNAGLTARHHSGVSFVSAETLAVHYSRGDAHPKRFTLNAQDCTVTSQEQTRDGAAATSSSSRHLKWAHPILAEQAHAVLGLSVSASR